MIFSALTAHHHRTDDGDAEQRRPWPKHEKKDLAELRRRNRQSTTFKAPAQHQPLPLEGRPPRRSRLVILHIEHERTT